MIQPGRIRRVFKWAGTLAVMLILLAWGLSYGWGVVWNTTAFGAMWRWGRIEILWWDSPFDLGFFTFETARANKEPYWFYPPRIVSSRGGLWTVVPFWLLFLAAALPTALLWRLDRQKIPVGHCRRCSYNLTGNVSGVCPECGTPIAPAPR